MLSLVLLLMLSSLTFIISSIFLNPYLSLGTQDIYFTTIICSINILFCIYYLWEVLNLGKVFKLKNKYIIKFGKRLGFITLLFLLQFAIFCTLLLRNLSILETILIFLILIIESFLIGVILKEVYDLVFQEEAHRDFSIEENRKKYFQKEKRAL
jgi:hypothetical protein